MRRDGLQKDVEASQSWRFSLCPQHVENFDVDKPISTAIDINSSRLVHYSRFGLGRVML